MASAEDAAIKVGIEIERAPMPDEVRRVLDMLTDNTPGVHGTCDGCLKIAEAVRRIAADLYDEDCYEK